MSVQVSYKKQVVFFIFLIFIVLAIAETTAKVWWGMVESCAFEESEVYAELSPELKRQMCVDSYQIQFSTEHIDPNQYSETVNINSFGFRGQEITLEKTENSFRIFTIGGSTMLGTGSTSDVTTIPGFLQEYYDSSYNKLKIEIINAGISGAWSLTETNLIKNKLLQFQPDLFIIYDGWNDAAEFNASNIESFKNTWKNRWIEICNIGKQQNFDVIITLQPIAGTGNKEMTEKEYSHAVYNKEQGYLERLEALSSTLDEIGEHCSVVYDLRNSFDNEKNAVFWDNGHVGNAGNKIIAKKLFELSLPLIKNYTTIENEFTPVLTAVETSSDSGFLKDEYVLLKRMVLQNYKTPLMIKYYFFNTDIIIHNDEVFENFKKPNIGDELVINEKDFTYSYLPNENFSFKTIENSNFLGSYMRKSIFENSTLINSNFTSVNLSEANFINSKFENVDFRSSDLAGGIFENSIFNDIKISGVDLTNANMRSVYLTDTDLRFTEIERVDFQNSDLSFSDFSEQDLRGTFFKNANLSFSNFKNIISNDENFSGALFVNATFSGAIIRNAEFSQMNFTNTDFSNALLSGTDFSNSDLSGVNFSSALLKNTNFENSNLEESSGGPFKGCINHHLCSTKN